MIVVRESEPVFLDAWKHAWVAPTNLFVGGGARETHTHKASLCVPPGELRGTTTHRASLRLPPGVAYGVGRSPGYWDRSLIPTDVGTALNRRTMRWVAPTNLFVGGGAQGANTHRASLRLPPGVAYGVGRSPGSLDRSLTVAALNIQTITQPRAAGLQMAQPIRLEYRLESWTERRPGCLNRSLTVAALIRRTTSPPGAAGLQMHRREAGKT